MDDLDWQVLLVIHRFSRTKREVSIDDVRAESSGDTARIQNCILRLEEEGLIHVDVDPEMFYPIIQVTEKGRYAAENIDLIKLMEDVQRYLTTHLRSAFPTPPANESQVLHMVWYTLRVAGYDVEIEEGGGVRAVCVNRSFGVFVHLSRKGALARVRTAIQRDAGVSARRYRGCLVVVLDLDGSFSRDRVKTPSSAELTVIRY